MLLSFLWTLKLVVDARGDETKVRIGYIGDKGKQTKPREGEPSKLTILESWGLQCFLKGQIELF